MLQRGNIGMRLRKAETGEVGATLLALAGLKRPGFAHRARRSRHRLVPAGARPGRDRRHRAGAASHGRLKR
jgi:porphobilinogen deaminase